MKTKRNLFAWSGWIALTILLFLGAQSGSLLDIFPVKVVDENDTAYGIKHTANEPHVLVKESALPAGAATAANQTNKTQTTKITDGINDVAVNADGQMHVVLMGMVDATNSSAALLGNGGIFTGAGNDVLNYGFIFITVFADQDSATDGLSFQQSSDNTNWDNTDDYNYTASTGKTYSIQPAARYFRVVYTNGTTPQGAFRLQTVYKKTSSLPSSHKISANLSPEDDATLGVSIIKGRNPGGDYVDFSATAGGNFKMSLEEFENNISSNSNTQLNVTQFLSDGTEGIKIISMPDPMLEIARGNVSGITHVNKFGENPDVVKNTTEDIWDAGGTYSFPSSALMTKVSQTTDQGDMQGETIEVQGLDVNWDLLIQTVNIDAANTETPVTLSTPLIRCFRMRVLADYVCTSSIRVHNDAENIDYAVIQTGNNQTLMAIYTVPNGTTAYITNYYAGTSPTGSGTKDPYSVEFELWTADRDNSYEFQLRHSVAVIQDGSSYVQHSFRPYLEILQKTDIKLTAAPSNDWNGHVHAGFDIILVNN